MNLVTVVDHPAFASLYQQELAQEGLPIEIIDVDRIPATTVSIYPDEARKDVKKLDILLPPLSPGHRLIPSLKGLTIEDVKKEFSKYKPLPLGGKGLTEINYEGRHLFTGELIEKFKIHLESSCRSFLTRIPYLFWHCLDCPNRSACCQRPRIRHRP